jgi:hypothetical protein
LRASFPTARSRLRTVVGVVDQNIKRSAGERRDGNRVSSGVGGEITKRDLSFPSSGTDRLGDRVGSAFVATVPESLDDPSRALHFHGPQGAPSVEGVSETMATARVHPFLQVMLSLRSIATSPVPDPGDVPPRDVDNICVQCSVFVGISGVVANRRRQDGLPHLQRRRAGFADDQRGRKLDVRCLQRLTFDQSQQHIGRHTTNFDQRLPNGGERR